MDVVTNFAAGTELANGNRILVSGERAVLQNDSKITFLEKNNILVVEDGVQISRSNIRFCGDNSVIYLSQNKNLYIVNIDVYHNSTVYIGKNVYINGLLRMVVSEQQNVIIGNDGLLSFGIYIRTADPHLIYDAVSKKRINQSASVLIGDHVWVGQNVLILKGTMIGSGAIIGGSACLAGKRIPSNVSAVGNPAKIVRSNVFFLHHCVHKWTDEVAEQYETVDTEDYLFSKTEKTADFEMIDIALKSAKSADERLEKLRALIVANTEKNRFALMPHAAERPNWFAKFTAKIMGK